MPFLSSSGLQRALFIAALCGLFVLAWTQRNRFTPVDEGSPAPEFAAETLDGDTFDLAALRGRVVVLNVWATWCIPCRREMPALQRLQDRLADRGLEVIGVSTDDAPTSDVRLFANGLQLTFPIIHDAKHAIEQLYLVQGLPTTFVIGRNGRIASKHLGAREWDDSAHIAEFEELLAQ